MSSASALDAGHDPLGLDLLTGIDPAWWADYCDVEDELIRRDKGLQAIELELCARSHLYFIQRYYRALHKLTGQEIRLVPNRLQARYERDRSNRNQILKARQLGFSTWIDARMVWRARFVKNQNMVITTHRADATAELFQRVKFAESRLPQWMRVPLERATTTLLRFEPQNSQIRVTTAGGQADVGRSGTIDALHESEIAFYPDPMAIRTGLEGSVRPDGWIDRETTANGFNETRVDWQDAQSGKSGYTPFFFAWYELPENRLDTGAPLELTTEEEQARDLFGLDERQMAWRRAEMVRLKGKFQQEQPETDAQAFLATGSPRFDSAAVVRLIEIVEHRVRPIPLDMAVPDSSPWATHLRDREHLEIWIPPMTGHRYLVAADVAGGGGGDADYSYASVLDVTKKNRIEQVARYRSNTIRPGPYGRLLTHLGRFYNAALLAIEENNHGHATIYAAQQEDYGDLYWHMDLVTGDMKDRPGFPTNVQTRAQILDMLGEAIVTGGMIFRDGIFLRECLTFEQGDEIDTIASAKSERRKSVKRDGVMANAIGFYCAMRSEPMVG